eukprot:5884014-Pyramimonas_sp.AAC.1
MQLGHGAKQRSSEASEMGPSSHGRSELSICLVDSEVDMGYDDEARFKALSCFRLVGNAGERGTEEQLADIRDVQSRFSTFEP